MDNFDPIDSKKRFLDALLSHLTDNIGTGLKGKYGPKPELPPAPVSPPQLDDSGDDSALPEGKGNMLAVLKTDEKPGDAPTSPEEIIELLKQALGKV